MYGLPDFNMLSQLVLTKFFKSELFSCLLDCERSLFFFKFSEGSAHADERWAAKPRDARNEGGIPRRKKKNRETARSLTLRSRFTCLACQPFSFHAKKSLDRERWSLFFPASPVSRLQSRAWSFACLARFARRTKKKERLLVAYVFTESWSRDQLRQKAHFVSKNSSAQIQLHELALQRGVQSGIF